MSLTVHFSTGSKAYLSNVAVGSNRKTQFLNKIKACKYKLYKYVIDGATNKRAQLGVKIKRVSIAFGMLMIKILFEKVLILHK